MNKTEQQQIARAIKESGLNRSELDDFHKAYSRRTLGSHGKVTALHMWLAGKAAANARTMKVEQALKAMIAKSNALLSELKRIVDDPNNAAIERHEKGITAARETLAEIEAQAAKEAADE